MCWRVIGGELFYMEWGAHEGFPTGDIRGKFKWPGGKEAFQTEGQTSWDRLPASSHWLLTWVRFSCWVEVLPQSCLPTRLSAEPRSWFFSAAAPQCPALCLPYWRHSWNPLWFLTTWWIDWMYSRVSLSVGTKHLALAGSVLVWGPWHLGAWQGYL